MNIKLKKIGKYYLAYEGNKPKINLNWFEQNDLAKKMSTDKKKYRLLTLQEAYDECSNSEFKELMEKYWIYNFESFKKGETTEDTAIDELMKRGQFKYSGKVYKGGIYFEDGLSAVGSDWGRDGGCFSADAGWPSLRGSVGFAVFTSAPLPKSHKNVKPIKRTYDQGYRDGYSTGYNTALEDLKTKIGELE